jgi:energy-coupling factor transporter ATP-binding protein EcfA2
LGAALYIERVQVEEGFLDGLNLEFSQGLNVVIGARGTGKSSLIELIRFCLNAKGHTGASERRSFEHAVSVLKSGQVTVTLRDGDQRIIVSRSADQDEPTVSELFTPPIVFSQSEIEAVGLDAAGRLRIVDGFMPSGATGVRDEVSKIGAVRSLTNDATRLRKDISDHEGRLEKLPEIRRQLEELAPDEERVAKVSSEAAVKTKILESLTSKISELSVRTDYVSRFLEGVGEWEFAVREALSEVPDEEKWGSVERSDPLLESKKHIATAVASISESIKAIEAARAGADSSITELSKGRQTFEDQSRTLRTEIESLQAGAGEIIRRGQKLREEKTQLEALRKVVADKKKILSDILQKRSEALAELEEVRLRRFSSRAQAADLLSSVLAPRIRIDVIHAKQVEGYAAAIANALRGSNLKYNELAIVLASIVSPRELIELSDGSNGEELAEIASISKDRAFRVLASLREADLGEIATIDLDDEVQLQLLDGGDYKPFADLSTGQRCTVILPIILEHRERILTIDQPEDHIDNAFITDTLIAGISRRSRKGQLILSTHNANIPVLGEAEFVVHLESDGRRGFVRTAGQLDAPKVVNSITTVMEGGVDAFRRRADFYNTYADE